MSTERLLVIVVLYANYLINLQYSNRISDTGNNILLNQIVNNIMYVNKYLLAYPKVYKFILRKDKVDRFI
jgi:hypothetical protein